MRYGPLALALVLTATPAFAQIGSITKRVGQAKDAKEKADKFKGINAEDERKIGEKVSAAVRKEFGVYQDKAVTKYVTLVGMVLAQASSKPDLKWEFIVLDTDGVNAFASPGGIVHITRGALGLIKSEAELAGVLGHEIVHVTERHTASSIEKNQRTEVLVDLAPGSNAYVEFLADKAYENIVEKGFDRGDENESDKEGLRLANKVGYNPSGLPTFLTKLAERNKGAEPTRNGLFASHPETESRIKDLNKQIKSEKLAAAGMASSRYASNIKFDVKPLSEIAAVIAGTRGVAGDEKTAKKEPEKDKKKDMFGPGGLKLSTGKQAESTQASASAGNRAVGTDRHAPGGSNPSKLTVPVTPAEIEDFKKGISG